MTTVEYDFDLECPGCKHTLGSHNSKACCERVGSLACKCQFGADAIADYYNNMKSSSLTDMELVHEKLDFIMAWITRQDLEKMEQTMTAPEEDLEIEKPGTVLIRATSRYGYRYGHAVPWGEILGVEWYKNKPCYRVRFQDTMEVDYWPVVDPSDPYAFCEGP